MVTFQTSIWISGNFTDGVNLQQALGSNANPFDLALLWDAAQVLPLKDFVVAHGSVFVAVISQFLFQPKPAILKKLKKISLLERVNSQSKQVKLVQNINYEQEKSRMVLNIREKRSRW